jgi:hypothetical protein
MTPSSTAVNFRTWLTQSSFSYGFRSQSATASVQAMVFKYINDHAPDPWVDLVDLRLSGPLAPGLEILDLGTKLKTLGSILKDCGPIVANTFIRTLTNSWCTSCRMHEDNFGVHFLDVIVNARITSTI